MDKELINISYTASYYKTGRISEHTKKVWLVFHGYGQLADDFAEPFVELTDEESCFIFPQGLSKFYLKGAKNKIGANWMTSHDREVDIANYLSYLDQLFNKEVKPYRSNIQLTIVGFSQGGHTAARWIYHSRIGYDRLVLWGSDLAQEIDRKTIQKSFSGGENLFVIGNRDRFFDGEDLKKLKDRYKAINFNYQLVKYNGGHEIFPKVVRNLI